MKRVKASVVSVLSLAYVAYSESEPQKPAGKMKITQSTDDQSLELGLGLVVVGQAQDMK